MYRNYKFRIYPSGSQKRILGEWYDACRFIWNLCHEQRLLGLSRCKDDKRFISAIEQQKQITAVRTEHPWLGKVPRHLIDNAALRVDAAWSRYFQKISGKPKWRKKSHFLSLTEFDPTGWHLKKGKLKFPCMKNIKIVLHRPVTGKLKRCTIKKDGDHWYAFICSELVENEVTPRIGSAVGIDRGINKFAADSTGTMVEGPRFQKKSQHLLTRAQRKFERTQKGSNRRKRAARKIANIHRRIRFQRGDFLHKLSRQYANNHSLVVLENLKVKNMLKGNCAYGIVDSGWSMFASMLEYKLNDNGGRLEKVSAHHSSQTCSACGQVDNKSRVGEKFSCTQCGHAEHSDVNAAKVILSRRDPSALPVEGYPKCRTQGNGKVKRKPCVRSSNKDKSL